MRENRTRNIICLFDILTLGVLDGGLGLVLWCLTPLSTIFQLYRGGHFY